MTRYVAYGSGILVHHIDELVSILGDLPRFTKGLFRFGSCSNVQYQKNPYGLGRPKSILAQRVLVGSDGSRLVGTKERQTVCDDFIGYEVGGADLVEIETGDSKARYPYRPVSVTSYKRYILEASVTLQSYWRRNSSRIPSLTTLTGTRPHAHCRQERAAAP
nr:hypothetical protein Iba_chr12cCG8860 [Ipomoea batatas]